jgi:hypothetical protein
MSIALRWFVAGMLVAMLAPVAAADRHVNVSGLWLDSERPTQGVLIEQIDSPDRSEARVIVSWFTWAPASDPDPGPRWLFGVGRRTGSTVVVDPLVIAHGGTFPIGVPVMAPQLDDWGRLEIEFSGAFTPEAAQLRFEGPPEWGAGERALSQITASGYGIYYGLIIDPPLRNIGAASGNYSSPEHPGQGWALNQFARTGTATDGTPRVVVVGLLIWYTYDAQGRPLWLFGLSDDMESNPRFALQRPASGGTFEGGEPHLEPWGEAVLFGAGPPPGGFQVSCDASRIAWSSIQPGFGAAMLSLNQITRAYPWNMGPGFCFSAR